MKKDLFGFETQGVKYDTYRPRYPAQFLQKTLHKTKGRNRYLDIATGTGQILFELHKNFQHSQGLDLSQKMIDVCKKKVVEKEIKNVEFRREDFLKADFGGNVKYDLITIGQALHWIPVKEFLGKCKGLLTDGGVLGIFGYILDTVSTDNQQFNKTLHQLYTDFYDKQVKKNFDFDRDELHTHYSNKERYPFEQIFPKTTREIIKIPIEMDKKGFISYLETFSGYNTYLEKYKDKSDPILPLKTKIPEDLKIKCLFDYFLIVCEA